MNATAVVLIGGLGLLIGSFLNVVIHRVPLGESIVRPASRCPGCGRQISPRDNVPVVSWVLLRARCRNCGEPISWRYPAVELLTGSLFAIMALQLGLTWELPAYLYLVAVGVALSFIDLDTKRLPNVIVLPSYGVMLILLLLPAVVENRWEDYLRAIIGGAVLFAFYFLLALVYPSGMGFGDVKLAGVLGIALGWMGLGVVVVGGFLGFLLGALVGGGLMLARRAGRKSAIPFGPFMISGALVAVVAGEGLAQWYSLFVFGA